MSTPTRCCRQQHHVPTTVGRMHRWPPVPPLRSAPSILLLENVRLRVSVHRLRLPPPAICVPSPVYPKSSPSLSSPLSLPACHQLTSTEPFSRATHRIKTHPIITSSQEFPGPSPSPQNTSAMTSRQPNTLRLGHAVRSPPSRAAATELRRIHPHRELADHDRAERAALRQ